MRGPAAVEEGDALGDAEAEVRVVREGQAAVVEDGVDSVPGEHFPFGLVLLELSLHRFYFLPTESSQSS